jgi:1,4-alpha-glucan branching enzyme
VTFEIPASLWANRVYLVGDFNNWNRCATPFECMHDEVWGVILDLPTRRRYEF